MILMDIDRHFYGSIIGFPVSEAAAVGISCDMPLLLQDQKGILFSMLIDSFFLPLYSL